MKRKIAHLIYILALGAGLFALASCHKDEEERWDHPKKKMDRTLIVYMAGENTLANFVKDDSVEIAAGLPSIPEGCRVVLYIDDAQSSRICVGTKTGPLKTVLTYSKNMCSTDSADMEAVFNDIYKLYPATRYGLVMWSHASGWVFAKGRQAPRRTFGIDNGKRDPYSNSGMQMNIPTLARVLKHYPHLDYIFFDACFMQCVEVAYELREVTDWVMGSSAEIPGPGAPYDYVIPHLAAYEADPQAALQAYYDYYQTGKGAEEYAGSILSAVRTSKLKDLADATAPLMYQLLYEHELVDCGQVQRYFPLDNSTSFAEFYDMSDFFHIHCTEEAYSQWRTILEQAVPYRYLSPLWSSAYVSGPMRVADPDYCAAVSMFVPTISHYSTEWMSTYRQLQWYDAIGMSKTGW
ncbi:MAG: hypothetical protein K6A32_06310 [Bacteroidales bacterium]|nr:hypothetical protein [Bacteroidales bacterium]